jgi:hypothetical protein
MPHPLPQNPTGIKTPKELQATIRSRVEIEPERSLKKGDAMRVQTETRMPGRPDSGPTMAGPILWSKPTLPNAKIVEKGGGDEQLRGDE